jgi:transcriptional regulator with PAS, ATPase and Fis domain
MNEEPSIDDLLLRSQYFLESACTEFSKELVGFSSEVIEKFLRYAWPGNVRELENMVTPPTIELGDVPTLLDRLHKHPRPYFRTSHLTRPRVNLKEGTSKMSSTGQMETSPRLQGFPKLTGSNSGKKHENLVFMARHTLNKRYT